jgi:hypothetical protein
MSLTDKERIKRSEAKSQRCQRELLAANASLEACGKELEICKSKLQTAEATTKEKDAQISRLGADLGVLTQKTLDLNRALEAATKVRPAIKIDELIGQLRTSLETLNEEARQGPQQDRSQLLVEQFEVEIKGAIDLKEGFKLAQLQGQEISPQSVSTIRFALRPVPVITIVDDSIANK